MRRRNGGVGGGGWQQRKQRQKKIGFAVHRKRKGEGGKGEERSVVSSNPDVAEQYDATKVLRSLRKCAKKTPKRNGKA